MNGLKSGEWNLIQINVSLCLLQKKGKILHNNYHINNVALSKKEMNKYLRISIDSKLNFNQHVQEKCKRATTVLNMLKRNLYFAPKSVKSKAYQASVLPILEYASNCWSPSSTKQNNLLEMVHHNAAKFVSNFYQKKGNYEKKIYN